MILTPEEITPEAYRPFGDVLSADRADVPPRPANRGTAEKKNHQIEVLHDRPLARPNFSSFRCAPRTAWPMHLELLEKHPRSTQVFVPMDGARFLAVVALGGDAPDLATLRAFVVRGAGVSYRPGVWHHPMIALDRPSDFACLVWEDGTSEDAVEHSVTGIELLAPPAVS